MAKAKFNRFYGQPKCANRLYAKCYIFDVTYVGRIFYFSWCSFVSSSVRPSVRTLSVCPFVYLLISAHSLGVNIDSVCLSVCLSVCHKLQVVSSFLFLEPFLPISSPWPWPPSTKHCFFIFDLAPPPNAQSLLPKICTKSPISRLVWQIDRRCLGLLQWFFEDGRFNGTMQNVVGPTIVAMATKFGLGTEIQSPTGLSLYIFISL